MEIIVGVVLALIVCGGAWWLGMDRERSFYAAMAMAVGSYYVAFAVVDGGGQVLLAETLICTVFVVAAIVGFKRQPWLIAGALAAHGLMDLVHHHLVDNAGVPAAWPGFCMAFDVTAGACMASVLTFQRMEPLGASDWFANRAPHRSSRYAADPAVRDPGRRVPRQCLVCGARLEGFVERRLGVDQLLAKTCSDA
jgi:hypothetical protein